MKFYENSLSQQFPGFNLSRFTSVLTKSIFCVAIILSASLHFYFFRCAGGFWRDEVSSLYIIKNRSLIEIWKVNEFDSFPMFWHVFLKFCSESPVLSSDLRIVGFLVGISILLAIYFNARFLFKTSFPILTILLIGTNPEIIRWSDSMRAYGLGVFFIILTTGLIWNVLKNPTLFNSLIAAIVSVLGVQTLYFNSVLLFSVCTAAMIVAISRRQWKSLFSILLAGAISAAGIIPYMETFERLSRWSYLVKVDFSLDRFITKIGIVLMAQGNLVLYIWVLFAALFLIGTISALNKSQSLNLTADQRDMAVFNFSAVLLSFASYFLSLKFLGYATEPWHYVPLIVLTAFLMESTISIFIKGPLPIAARLAAVIIIAYAGFQPALDGLQKKQTNIDLIAAKISALADKDDLVLVNFWEAGTSFDYYYKGSTPWMTTPPVASHDMQRYDLVKPYMSETEPLEASKREIEKTLSSGHRLWVVGNFFAPTGFRPGYPGPPPLPGTGWHLTPYLNSWYYNISYFIQNRGIKATLLELGETANRYENPALIMIEGYRPPNTFNSEPVTR